MSMATLAVALVALLVASVVGWNAGRSALDEKIRDQVVSIRIDRAHHIEDYFSSLRALMLSSAMSPATVEAAEGFADGFDLLDDQLESDTEAAAAAEATSLERYYEDIFLPRLAEQSGRAVSIEEFFPAEQAVNYLQSAYISDNPEPVGSKERTSDALDGSSYSDRHGDFHPGFRKIVSEFGLYDLFLIEPENLRIVYSVYKEADFATSLRTGPYSQSQLGAVARAVKADPVPGDVKITDFATYDPSYGAPAGFMATPLFDDAGTFVGILAMQLPIDRINAVMTVDGRWPDVGMGSTGEAYLVGSDRRMRSESRRFLEEPTLWDDIDGADADSIRRHSSTILFQSAATAPVLDAFSPDQGVTVAENYLGDEVISAFAPINVRGLDWVIVAELSTAEAFAPSADYRRLVIITAVALAALVTFLAVAMAERFVQPFLSLSRRSAGILSPSTESDEVAPVSFGVTGEAVEALGDRLADLHQRHREADGDRERYLQRLLPAVLARRAAHGDMESIDTFSSLTVVSIDTTLLDPGRWPAFVSEVEHSAQANDLEIISIDGRRLVAACGLRQGHLDQVDRVCRFAARSLAACGDGSSAGIASGPTAFGFVGVGVARGDLWGEAPHEAHQHMLAAEVGRICLAESLMDRIAPKTIAGLPEDILQSASEPAVAALSGGVR